MRNTFQIEITIQQVKNGLRRIQLVVVVSHAHVHKNYVRALHVVTSGLVKAPNKKTLINLIRVKGKHYSRTSMAQTPLEP